VVNATPGAPHNATAERLAVMMRVTAGSRVTVEMIQLLPNSAGEGEPWLFR
jgi:hypothetical protein